MSRPVDRQAGMTLFEILIAVTILAIMLSMAWSTTLRVSETRRTVEGAQDRSQELRVGLARVVRDLEHAYLSKNENMGVSADRRRTRFVGKDGGRVDELEFSSLAHQPLWAEANESDQTVIRYYAAPDRERSGQTNWLRREQRRMTDEGESPDDTPADVDVVFHGVEQVDFEFWDWKDQEWQPDWDSTGQDRERDRLPTRVRITVRWKEEGVERKVVTQARLLLQEPVESRFGTQYEQGGR